MPLPTPNEDETQDQFESRCMGTELMQSEYPNQDQRYAICRKQWERRHSAKSEETDVDKK